jgi:multidrug resistance efflux pump
MSAKSRATAEKKRHFDRIKRLEQRIPGSRGKLQQIRETVEDLRAQLRSALKDISAEDPCQSPSERIDSDILQNHGRDTQGRQSSLEALLWAR